MQTLTISKQLWELMAIVERFGPDENEYPVVNSIVNGIKSEKEKQSFRELIKPMLTEDTLFGHTFIKPFGYAGDYLLIEKIYQRHVSKDIRYKRWDKYYHSHEATEAVRNRKAFFVKNMEQLCSKRKGNVNVLILGSGPATDVHDFFVKNPGANIKFDLLDIDQRAIDYAYNKNERFLKKINFIRMNVLRFQPDKKYDLIWSAGLFDYLNDRLFTGLLSRFKNYVKEEGEIIIGNFSPLNPTRNVMEIICDWYLTHRSSFKLSQLAVNAEIPREIIKVDKEPLGINLFLRIDMYKLNAAKLFKLNKANASSQPINSHTPQI